MNKINRGEAGYCNYAKKAELIKTIVMFALVFAILITGIVTTGTRMNLLTIVAVVGCLPASRYCVNFIARAPYHSMDRAAADEIRETAGKVPVLFELMISGKDKVRYVDSAAVCGHSVCGWASEAKTDIPDCEQYLRKVLRENGHSNMTVKLFRSKEEYLNRLSEMEARYNSEENTRSRDKAIAHLITLICL